MKGGGNEVALASWGIMIVSDRHTSRIDGYPGAAAALEHFQADWKIENALTLCLIA